MQNKCKMLRLIHGDVYCAERLFRFVMSDNDKCRRCFQTETIEHLLIECPYTCEVYSLLGITDYEINNLIGVNRNKPALEIRCDILGYLIFRQHTLPPEILVRTTLEKFANNLAIKACKNALQNLTWK
jgi:hypothetical protein